MTETRKKWVVGFLFRNQKEIALVSKTHPEWQAGKLNGVGGKIEEDETPLEAMRREFLEEAGAAIDDWKEFALLKLENGDVHFFVAHGDYEIKSKTDEEVDWYPVSKIEDCPIISNLKWLIPLALDPEARRSTIDSN